MTSDEKAVLVQVHNALNGVQVRGADNMSLLLMSINSIRKLLDAKEDSKNGNTDS
jgi:hypothetical protein